MKLCVYADLQATEGTDRLRHDRTMPLQRWRVSKVLRDLQAIMVQQGCRGLIDLGDTTNERHSVPTGTIQALTAGLATMALDPAVSLKLIGNHEQHHKSGLVHTGGMYHGLHRVIPDREVIAFGDVAVVCASYPEDDAELAGWLDMELDALAASGYRTLLLGHFQVAGSKLAGGTSESGVPYSVVNKATLALLGHVHRPQKLPGAGNAHYVGSPFQQNFGEAGEHKRAAVLDLTTLDLTFVPLPGYPVYRRVGLADLPTTLDQLGEDRYEVTLNTPAEVDQFFKHPLAGQVVPVVVNHAGLDEATADPGEPVVARSDRDWLAQYAATNAIAVPGLTTEALVAAGLSLIS